jgi:vitamin B12 transporter
VISITTKSGSGPPKLTLSTEGGSFGTTNERASLSGSEANFNYVFNVQHFQSIATPVTPSYDLLPGEQANPNYYNNWTHSTKLGYNVSDNLAFNVVGRYTDSNLRFTGDDFNDFSPLSFAEPIQSTQLDHQFYGRAEMVWSPFAGFKNFFGVNYTNSWTWNFDPNPDNFVPNPLIVPPQVIGYPHRVRLSRRTPGGARPIAAFRRPRPERNVAHQLKRCPQFFIHL